MDYVEITIIDSSGQTAYKQLVSPYVASGIKQELLTKYGATPQEKNIANVIELFSCPKHNITFIYHQFARIAESQVREILNPRPEGSIL